MNAQVSISLWPTDNRKNTLTSNKLTLLTKFETGTEVFKTGMDDTDLLRYAGLCFLLNAVYLKLKFQAPQIQGPNMA